MGIDVWSIFTPKFNMPIHVCMGIYLCSQFFQKNRLKYDGELFLVGTFFRACKS